MADALGELIACYVCGDCGCRCAGARPLCPQCGHAVMSRMDDTPTGSVLDFVPVVYPPDNLKSLGRYVSVLVRLDNGCNVFGIMLEGQADVEVGQHVTAVKCGENGQGPFFQKR